MDDSEDGMEDFLETVPNHARVTLAHAFEPLASAASGSDMHGTLSDSDESDMSESLSR